MKFCPKCGTMVLPNKEICYCGEPINFSENDKEEYSVGVSTETKDHSMFGAGWRTRAFGSIYDGYYYW